MRDFAPHQQALELKELGFDEPCLAHLSVFGDGTIEDGRYKIIQQQVFYPNDYTTSDDKAEELGLHSFVLCGVPLFQQAFRWFREKYFIHCEIGRDFDTWDYELYDFKSNTIIGNRFFAEEGAIPTGFKTFNTYEETELACLNKLIEITKTK